MKKYFLNTVSAVTLCFISLAADAQFCSPAINQFANPQITNANPKTDMILGNTYPVTFRFANTGDPDSIIANTLEIIVSLPNSTNMAFQSPYLAPGSGCGIWTVDAANSGADAIVLHNTGGVTSASSVCDIQFLVKALNPEVTVQYSVAVNRTRPSCVGDADPSAANNTKSGSLLAPAVALPVTMQLFTAEAAACEAQLNWVTTSERKTDHFDIEYSDDAIRFIKAGSTPCHNKPNGSSYKFTYGQPEGTGYYRLKIVDVDGKYEYSKIAVATTQCSAAGIKVYPNPATDYVDVRGIKAGSTIKVFNAAGQLVYQALAQNSVARIATGKWSSGNYHLTIISEDGKEVSSFKLSKL